MRTLNVRLMAICLGAMVLLGGGVHLWHWIEVRKLARAFERLSEDRISDEDLFGAETDTGTFKDLPPDKVKGLDEAIRLQHQCVGLEPRYREAQLRLGMLYAIKHSARPASNMLEEVFRTADDEMLQNNKENLRRARGSLINMYLQLNDPQSAREQFQRLIQDRERDKEPMDARLFDLLGRINVQDKKYEDACKSFRDAIKADPTFIDAYLHLADVDRVFLNRKAESDAVMLDMVTRKDKQGQVINGKSLPALQHYAIYLREQGKNELSLDWAKRILELNPENSVGLWIAGSYYLIKGEQFETAEDFLQRGIKAEPQPGLEGEKIRALTYRHMADVKLRRNKPDEAISVYKQGLVATRGSSQYAEVLFGLANLLTRLNRIPDAAKYIEELREFRDPRSQFSVAPARVAFLDAQLAFLKGDLAAAEPILKQIIPKLQDAPGIQAQSHIYLADCYRRKGDVKNEIVHYTEALKVDPRMVTSRYGLARAYERQGDLAAALEQYSRIPDRAAAFSAAQIMILMCTQQKDKEKRDWERVNKTLDEIEKNWMMSPGLAVLRAEVMLAKDDDSQAGARQAGDFLAQQTKVFANAQVWLALIRLSMHQAEKTSDANEKEKLWNQAADDVARAEQQLGDRVDLRTIRGELASRRKDPRLTELLKKLGENPDKLKEPERLFLWNYLAGLSMQAGDFELARSYYRLAAKQDSKNVIVRYLICDLNLRKWEKGQASELQELDTALAEIEQLGGRGAFWLYGKAVRTLVQSKYKDPDPQALLDAQEYLRQASANRRDWAMPAALAGKICEFQNEPDQALEYYLSAIRLGDRSNDVIRNTVKLLVPRNEIDKAKQLFDYLEQQKSPLLDEMSQQHELVLAARGDISKAATAIGKSVAADSRNDRDFLRQGQMYGILAKRLLLEELKASREEKPDPEIIQAKHKQMIEMGQLAVNSLLSARRLNPQFEETWASLVQLLVDVGRPDKAAQVVGEAEKALAGERASITLAACCQAVGAGYAVQANYATAAKASKEASEAGQTAATYLQKAQTKYEEAVKAAPHDARVSVLRQAATFFIKTNKSDRAETLLHQMIALQSSGKLVDVCWARRSLALILKDKGDFEHFSQGLALIDENLKSKAATLDDKRVRISFLLKDPRKAKMDEAIHDLEDLVKDASATAEDYFRLAQLYLQKGDWLSYVKCMPGALGTQKGGVQLRYLFAHIRTLLEKKELDDADKWLQVLEKPEKDGGACNLFDTIQLRAEYQVLRGNFRAGADLCMDFLNNSKPVAFLGDLGAKPLNRGLQLQLVAIAMEKFGDQLKAAGKVPEAADFMEKAETLFKSVRSAAAAGDIVFASFLARHDRFNECLDILEQCRDKCKPDDLIDFVPILVQSKKTDAGQYQRLEKILQSAAEKAGRPMNLLYALAQLHYRQGLYDQAAYDKSAVDYREMLAKDPKNFVAMNNLGLYLARSGRDLNEGLKLVNQGLAITGPLADVLDSRAVVYIYRKEFAKAMEDLAVAVKDQGNAEEYFHKAWACSQAGNRDEAAASFKEAVKKGLDRGNLDPHEFVVYDQLKNTL
jgi:cellulose synthase operon protein C